MCRVSIRALTAPLTEIEADAEVFWRILNLELHFEVYFD
jgi:hypothetical protein